MYSQKLTSDSIDSAVRESLCGTSQSSQVFPWDAVRRSAEPNVTILQMLMLGPAKCPLSGVRFPNSVNGK